MKMDRRALLCVLGATPLAAQSTDHQHRPPAAVPGQRKAPASLNAHHYQLLRKLCDFIIPADEHAAGAIEAGVPEFIDLLTGENSEYQRTIPGGLTWLDAYCRGQNGKEFLECTDGEQRALLDAIAFRENAGTKPELVPGVQFFTLLRSLTLDGYFTSRIGIDYLGFKGNSALTQFKGCPGK
jgi:hypothetical protein